MAAVTRWPRKVDEIWLFARVLALLAVLRLAIPRVRLETLLAWLAPGSIPSKQGEIPLLKAVRYTDALLRRFRFPAPGTCLPRTLVLYYFASRSAPDVTFCCGIKRRGRTLEGHAWLMREGEPFLEHGHPEQQFAITLSFPK
jgi:hypothetical protein